MNWPETLTEFLERTSRPPDPLDTDEGRAAFLDAILAPPCEFTGDGVPHDGPTAWIEMACIHGHTETGWGCERHRAVAVDRVTRGGQVRCGRCGHVCPLALRVPATGEVAGVTPWPGGGR